MATAAPTTAQSRGLVDALAASLPLLFFLYANGVTPRPYYVSEIDIEPDYYYNARLILEGKGPLSFHHPGTPIYYLGALLLSLTGSDPANAQTFFRLAYLAVAIATGGAMLFFSRRCLSSVPRPVGLLCLASILAWPSLLTYQDFFGADSFVVAVGLPTLALVWNVIRDQSRAPSRDLLLGGVGLGACLAIKMSFVPVALAVAGATLLWSLGKAPAGPSASAGQTPPSAPSRARGFLFLTLGGAGAYLLLTAPIVGNLPWVWINTFHRSEIRIPHGHALAALATQSRELFQVNPLWMATAVISAATLTVSEMDRFKRTFRAVGLRSVLPRPDHALVGLLLVAFAYAVAASITVGIPELNPGSAPRGEEPGARFRNAWPAALVLPFLVLLAFEAIATNRRRKPAAPFLRLLGGMGVGVILWAFATHLAARGRFIHQRLETIAATQRALSSGPSGTSRIAFWTGPSTDYLGEASFHFWGNYRYANDYFDRQLIERFPRLTFFRGLREMRIGRIGPDRQRPSESSTRSRFGGAGDLLWTLHDWLRSKRPPPEKTEDFFAGQRFGVRVDEIAIPTSEAAVELRATSLSRLPHLAAYALGSNVQAREQRIGSVCWTLLRPASPPE